MKKSKLISLDFGAGGGTRTHTPSLTTDFESASSAIPTHRHILLFARNVLYCITFFFVLQ